MGNAVEKIKAFFESNDIKKYISEYEPLRRCQSNADCEIYGDPIKYV